jgi:phosphoglycerate dehydrogenase-like enzyme
METMTSRNTSRTSLVATCIGEQWARSVLDDAARARIASAARVISFDGRDTIPAHAEVTVLVTGWGSPTLTDEVLDGLPALELVLHAAGTVRGIATPALWERGIRLATAASANAVPVADFTWAQVVLSLKNTWRLALESKLSGQAASRDGVRGLNGATIGLIGLGRVGRLVAERLAPLDVNVMAFDPFATAADASRLDLSLEELDKVFASSDVLSLHAPLTDDTMRMVRAEQLELLPVGATIINTARGGLIDHTALADVLGRRPDLFAVLDVTDPEPLPDRHPLLTMPNTIVTPHIAGSLGHEEAQLGRLMVDELMRHLTGEPLRHEVLQEHLLHAA